MSRLLIVAALAVSSSVAAAQGVSVTLTEWKLSLSRDTVKAGPVTFRVTNGGAMSHAFYVRGAGVDKGTRDIAKGESGSLTVTLKPGLVMEMETNLVRNPETDPPVISHDEAINASMEDVFRRLGQKFHDGRPRFPWPVEV